MSLPTNPPPTQPQPGWRLLLALSPLGIGILVGLRILIANVAIRQSGSLFSGLSGLAIGLVVAPLLIGASFVGAFLVTGFALRMLRYRGAFVMSGAASIMLYLSVSGSWLQATSPIVYLALLVVINAATYGLAYALLHSATTSLRTHLLLIIVSIVALGSASNVIATLESSARQQRAIKETATQADNLRRINFQPYLPGYLPTGFTIRDPKLSSVSSYQPSLQAHLDGPGRRQSIAFAVGKMLDSYAAAIKPPTNCDVNHIFFAIELGDGIGTNYHYPSVYPPCPTPVVTPGGYTLYSTPATRSQNHSFYLVRSDTIIALSFDSVNGMAYNPSFLPELIKMVDSLKPVGKTELRLNQ